MITIEINLLVIVHKKIVKPLFFLRTTCINSPKFSPTHNFLSFFKNLFHSEGCKEMVQGYGFNLGSCWRIQSVPQAHELGLHHGCGLMVMTGAVSQKWLYSERHRVKGKRVRDEESTFKQSSWDNTTWDEITENPVWEISQGWNSISHLLVS